MAPKIAALCHKCGPVYPDPERTVIYATPGEVRRRSFRLGFRCPKCDALCLQGTSRENAQAACDGGSVALWGETHPVEVTEREFQMKNATAYTWDEYLDGYAQRAARR